jgi:hypothetical protein
MQSMTTVEKAVQVVVASTIVPEMYGTTIEVSERYSEMQKTCGRRAVKYV